jgi:transposase
MSRALSLDLRVRVLAAVRAGATHCEAADRFGVSAASVSRWRTLERNQEMRVRRRWAATGGRGASKRTMNR